MTSLFVFHIDKGTMLTFDLSIRNGRVRDLCDEIARLIGIPTSHQNLLVSGGEVLTLDARLSSYSAGADTDPFFLVTKLQPGSTVSSHTSGGQSPSTMAGAAMAGNTPSPSASLSARDRRASECYGSTSSLASVSGANEAAMAAGDESMARFVRALKEMEHHVDSSASGGAFRCQDMLNRVIDLATRVCEQTQVESDYCDSIVTEHFFLQQGWFIVIANMEDSYRNIAKRLKKFADRYKKYLKNKNTYVELFRNFGKDLSIIDQVPVLPCLLSPTPELSAGGVDATPRLPGSPSVQPDLSVTSSNRFGSNPALGSSLGKPISILQWIQSQDTNRDMKDFVETVNKALSELDEGVLARIAEDAMKLERESNRREQKEIKGLNKRLSKLADFQRSASQCLEEQRRFHDSVVGKAQKARTSRDQRSDFTRDLVLSLLSSIERMINQHFVKVHGIFTRFEQCKVELVTTIQHRLSWIQQVELEMSRVDHAILVYGEKMERLKYQLDLAHQIRNAPIIYATALTEVVRRRSFTAQYLQWADELFEALMKLLSKEKDLRTRLNSKLKNHFLSILFPGMSDMPPDSPMSTKMARFDQLLPSVSIDDIRYLRSEVPSLIQHFTVCRVNIFEELCFTTPETISTQLKMLERRASFISNTPPKFLLNKSMPSSAWMSDENLDEDSSDFGRCGSIEVGSAGSSRMLSGRRRYDSRRFDEDSAFPLLEDFGSLEDDDSASSSAPSRKVSSTSAPIRIPSREKVTPPLMGSHGGSGSRQMSVPRSEKSHFGTPEEVMMDTLTSDVVGTTRAGVSCLSPSPDLMLDSPPEMLSRSQISTELGSGGEAASSPKRICAASSTNGGNSRSSVTFALGSPSRHQSPRLIDEPGSNRSLTMPQPFCRGSALQQGDKLSPSGSSPISVADSHFRMVLEERDRFRRAFLSLKTLNTSVLIPPLRIELAEVRQIMETLLSQSSKTLQQSSDGLNKFKSVTSCQAKEVEKLASDVGRLEEEKCVTNQLLREIQLQNADIVESKVELEQDRNAILAANSELTKKCEFLEMEVSNATAAVEQKNAAISELLEKLKVIEADAERAREDEKAEVIKQLTLANELDMEELKKCKQTEMIERDQLIQDLRDQIHELELVTKDMQKEQDQMVQSMVDQKQSLEDNEKEELDARLSGLTLELTKKHNEELRVLNERWEEKLSTTLKSERSQIEQECEMRAKQIVSAMEAKLANQAGEKAQIERQNAKAELSKSVRAIAQASAGQMKEDLHAIRGHQIGLQNQVKESLTALQSQLLGCLDPSAPYVLTSSPRQSPNAAAIDLNVDNIASPDTEMVFPDGEIAGQIREMISPNSATAGTSAINAAGHGRADGVRTADADCGVQTVGTGTNNVMELSALSPTHPGFRGVRRPQVFVDRIREGDLVLALKDSSSGGSGAYVVATLSSKMAYYVDTKTLDPAVNGRDRFIGRVKRKNHCMAKKEINRFQVPMGTRFYLFDLEYVKWRGQDDFPGGSPRHFHSMMAPSPPELVESPSETAMDAAEVAKDDKSSSRVHVGDYPASGEPSGAIAAYIEE